MLNKYYYSLMKDRYLQILFLTTIIAMAGCIIFFKYIVLNESRIIDAKNKKNIIEQIPAFEAHIKMTRQQHMVLNGIILSEDQYIAVINNTIVKKGDMIDTKHVVDVTKDYVVVCEQQENKCIELSL